MEENKKAKEVEMKVVEGKTSKIEEKPKKLTYEQLNEACNQLFQQNQQLRKKLDEVSAFNAFKRLDYLLKVIELSDIIGDAEFTDNCIKELKEAMTIQSDVEANEQE